MSDTLDLLTVVTLTVGDSASALETLCAELRKFTRLGFRQIISDNGTISGEARQRQRDVACRHDAHYTENPGPTYGIDANLNHALSLVKTPWFFLVEDGLRPSWGWLETARWYIENVGAREWQGFQVGMMGTSIIPSWLLSMGDAIPGPSTFDDFYASRGEGFYGDWNDGYWCWRRLADGVGRKCHVEGAGWLGEPSLLRALVLNSLDPPGDIHDKDFPLKSRFYYWTLGFWPQVRSAALSWYASPPVIINTRMCREAGGFRNSCTFFEGHLGTRLARSGILSLRMETPPWLHLPGQGFARAKTQSKAPQIYRDEYQIFLDDFGHGHLVAGNKVALVKIPLEVQRSINTELAVAKAPFCFEWEKYL